MATTTISQLSCFTSVSRRNSHSYQRRSLPFLSLRSSINNKFSVALSLEGRDAETSDLGSNPNMSYVADLSSSSVEVMEQLHPEVEEQVNGKVGSNGPVHSAIEEKKTAKIHDFCFGIPFGGLVLVGGILSSIFSKNLSTGVIHGGGLLYLSTTSMKVWKQGKTSLPFILGQAALGASLLWKSFQDYSLTKKLFPSGFYGFVSAAMLLFYSYVVISGGNPPPKKLSSATSAAS